MLSYFKKFYSFLTFKVLLILDVAVSNSLCFKTKSRISFSCHFILFWFTIFSCMLNYFPLDSFRQKLLFLFLFLLFLKTVQFSSSWKYRKGVRVWDGNTQGATIQFVIPRFSKVFAYINFLDFIVHNLSFQNLI